MEVVQRKALTTVTGLRFYWPDTEITKSGYVTNTTSIFNYPIQSFATADIMPLVLCLIWHRVNVLGDAAILANTIHDSVVADVEEASIADYKQIVVECFTRDIYPLLERLYGIKFDIALGVGIKAGEFWSEGEENKYEPALKSP
jgi:DNA polymerase I-like protein with 3'-5' exonuclease and polymerase domains